jgi:TRAP-type C4-dicarboxylate transport system permease small subunit
MTVFIQSVRRLSRLCGIFSALLLIAAVLVVSHLVFVRYVLGTSAIWQHEFVTFSLIAATFFGGPYLLLTHGHVNVDLLPMYLGRRGRMAMALLASLLSLAFCLIIAWSGFVWWQEAWSKNWHAETVWAPPLWIPYLAMPIGVGLMALQYIADILALVTGRTAPFGMNDDGSHEPA